MKKHIALDKKEHRQIWSRLVCSKCSEHADCDAFDFLSAHKSCDKQHHTNTQKMTDWLNNIMAQHPPTERLSEGVNSESDCLSEISEGEEDEELEAQVTYLTEAAFSPEQAPQQQPEQAVQQQAVPAPQQQLPEPGPQEQVVPATQKLTEPAPQLPQTTAPITPTVAPITSVPTAPIAPPKPTTSKNGVQRQNRKWTKDLEKKAVSQQTAYTCLLDKHRALTLRYCDLEKQNAKLITSEISLKKTTEELMETKQELQNYKRHVRELTTQCSKLEARVTFTNETIKYLTEENKQTKHNLAAAEKRTMSSSSAMTTTNVHIPFVDGEIIDSILTFNSDESDQECYEDPSQGVKCQHLTIKSAGKVAIKSWRVKKRAVRRIENEAHKRQRQD